tara:strand:- start:299 stop:412 length:114 start_codon:yes stop_codon:yes gene_type:complete
MHFPRLSRAGLKATGTRKEMVVAAGKQKEKERQKREK